MRYRINGSQQPNRMIFSNFSSSAYLFLTVLPLYFQGRGVFSKPFAAQRFHSSLQTPSGDCPKLLLYQNLSLHCAPAPPSHSWSPWCLSKAFHSQSPADLMCAVRPPSWDASLADPQVWHAPGFPLGPVLHLMCLWIPKDPQDASLFPPIILFSHRLMTQIQVPFTYSHL